MRNWFSRQFGVPAEADTATASTRQPPARNLSSDVLHLFVMTSFAVAEPFYGRLGKQSAFLVDQNITFPTASLLVFLLSFGLPAAVALVEILTARWNRRIQDALHSMVVFVCLVLWELPVCSRVVFLTAPWMLSLALAVGSLSLWCYFEFRIVRVLVTWSAPGILIFPTVFLAEVSSATATIRPSAIRSESREPAPVVLLVFDEFCGLTLMNPAREIDEERFPNFAALSRQSTWFRNASSVSPLTMLAVPAILSGRYLDQSYAPQPAELPQNLFNVLTATGGYDLASFEPISRLAPRSLSAAGRRPTGTWEQTCLLADILWRIYLYHLTPNDYHARLPAIPRVWFGWHDSEDVDRTQIRGNFVYGWTDQRDDQFQHFLNCIDGSPRPTFFFGHFLLPHVPWCYLPSGRRYATDGKDWELLCLETDRQLARDSDQDPLVVTQNQQRYLLQLMYLDRLLGDLMSRLNETGILDRCLLIVTADHGVSFRAGQHRRQLEVGNQDEILSIPLFIKRPHQTAGHISDRPVETVDILPTVADVLGLTLQAPTDGWSVFDTSRPERTRLTVKNNSRVIRVNPTLIRDSQTPAVLRQRFGNSADPEALFRIGPIPDLVGRTVRSLPQSTDMPVEIDLLRYGDSVGDEPNAIVPCYFEGTVLSPNSADQSVVIAIAINGTIRAVTRTFQQMGIQNRWAALVPEWAFQTGRNDIEFFSVNGPDRRLTPCGVSDSTKRQTD